MIFCTNTNSTDYFIAGCEEVDMHHCQGNLHVRQYNKTSRIWTWHSNFQSQAVY